MAAPAWSTAQAKRSVLAATATPYRRRSYQHPRLGSIRQTRQVVEGATTCRSLRSAPRGWASYSGVRTAVTSGATARRGCRTRRGQKPQPPAQAPRPWLAGRRSSPADRLPWLARRRKGISPRRKRYPVRSSLAPPPLTTTRDDRPDGRVGSHGVARRAGPSSRPPPHVTPNWARSAHPRAHGRELRADRPHSRSWATLRLGRTPRPRRGHLLVSRCQGDDPRGKPSRVDVTGLLLQK
jgi:hypothetical protein